MAFLNSNIAPGSVGEAAFVDYTQQGFDAITALKMAGYTRYDAASVDVAPGDYGTARTSLDPGAVYSIHPLASREAESTQLVEYTSPSAQALASVIPSFGSFDAALADLIFEGEIGGETSGASSSSGPSSSSSGAVTTGAGGVPLTAGLAGSPWLLVALIVVVLLVLSED